MRNKSCWRDVDHDHLGTPKMVNDEKKKKSIKSINKEYKNEDHCSRTINYSTTPG